MKKLLLFVFVSLLFSLPQLSKAQLTELHTFTGEIVQFNTSQGLMYTEYLQWGDNVLTVYKSDFTFYKDIVLYPNATNFFLDVGLLSDKLFNSDSKLSLYSDTRSAILHTLMEYTMKMEICFSIWES